MKKLKLFGLAALMLALLCTLVGCPDDPDPDPEMMSFVNTDSSKKFTIDENLKFEVTFVSPDTTLQYMGVAANDKIWGNITKITPSDNWKTSPLVGTIASLDSNSVGLKSGVGDAQGLPVSLVYVKSGDNITSVTVSIPSGAITDPTTLGLIAMANEIIGGTYNKQ